MLHEVEEMTKKKVSIKKKVAKKVPEEVIEKTVKEETVPAEPSISEKEDRKHEKKADMIKKPAKKEEVVKRAIRKEAAHGKKSNLTLVYIGLAVLVIAALVMYFSSTAPEKPEEKLPTAGKYVKLNQPSTYEPGKVKITEFLKFNCGHCFSLNPQLPVLKKKYGDNLSITYKPMLWRSVPQDQAFRKSI
jgi:protein-disulfide isomerase